MGRLEITSLPGRMRVASGGTRTSINLDRPWQTDIAVDPSKCPFEKKDQIELARFERDGGWRVLDNPYTPFSWHRLIVPQTCWPKEELRSLGGEEKIAAVLRIASTMMRRESGEFWLGVHVGPSAGQNIGHLHYHLLQPLMPANHSAVEGGVPGYVKSCSLVLSEEHGYKAVVGGHRAAQCFIAPLDPSLEFGDSEAVGAAKVLSRLISLFNMKFLSTQGLPPDYIVAMGFLPPRMVYASYIPILNNWGLTEYLGLLEERPLILPWPHEESFRFLQS